ncbi:MAG TPA: DUF2127 domain-containing protein [Steroidobacteraceae bacterium]|jgi:uncharacterized membrane protein (DUF2068 family)|nr:DUF2127 domain-containing protein [Steroidobacteraceae bacterium]
MDAQSPSSGGGTVPAATPRKFDGLRLIALLKFGKVLLLIATSYGVHKLLNAALVERLYTWSAALSDDRFERKLLMRALTWVEGLGAKKIQIFLAVTIAYTAVALTEGIGLWLRRTWGEWLTVIATSSLIPFELWELITRPPGRRLALAATLGLNLLIVWYLARQLRKAVGHPPPQEASG